jgi:hypothetical protein
MMLVEHHITLSGLHHPDCLQALELWRRADGFRRPRALARMRTMPHLVIAEIVHGVGAVRCHMVLTKAVDAAPH